MKKGEIVSGVLKIMVNFIIVITFINGLIFAGIGVVNSVTIYIDMITGHEGHYPVGIGLIKVIDNFLIAFVLIILGIGFAQLFNPDSSWLKQVTLSQIKIGDFHDLKSLLWDTILLALVVAFGALIITNIEELDWNHLVIPAAVLLLAGGAKLIRH